ncbi:cytochrome P450 [Microbispora corallina]|uniref:Cytochrome P450 n=1 Tax=Microbispora corallina TaxID=83302 RepID=A0ABQ4FYT2_9ACTN|nr:cytochrome P450 [Microbispora corallina]GIH39976.1 cytochrome P450 [Microbispora corallina]
MAEHVTGLAGSPAELMATLVSSEGRRNRHAVYDALRAHGGVVAAGEGLLAVLGYAECLRALREPKLRVQDERSHDVVHPGWRSHSSLRGFTDWMLYTNPPDHTRLRRLVTGAFTARRVAALQPAVERLTDRLLDRMDTAAAGGTPVDFMAEFAFRLPVAVIGVLLGVPEDDQVWFRAAAAEVTLALEGLTDLSRLARADAAMDELSAYFTALVEERRRRPADDMLSALVRVHDDDGDRLSGDELIGNLVLLLVAGFDTTTNLLGHALRLAFEHPAHAARLREGEPGFAAAYVEETLRVEPPVQATSRWAGAPFDLMGTPVPEGTKLLLLLAACNRDPRRHPDPHRFDPERPDNRPLSFGGGVHLCVGAGLARMEASVALPRLLRRFPGIAPAGAPAYRNRLVVPGFERFPVSVR